MKDISKKLISVDKARELQANWEANQAKALKENDLKDVREFLFDLEELQEYINLVRDKSKEQGIENPGIRIYFGAYSEESGNDSTVFLAPTKTSTSQIKQLSSADDSVANNYEISPLNTVLGGYPPIPY